MIGSVLWRRQLFYKVHLDKKGNEVTNLDAQIYFMFILYSLTRFTVYRPITYTLHINALIMYEYVFVCMSK